MAAKTCTTNLVALNNKNLFPYNSGSQKSNFGRVTLPLKAVGKILFLGLLPSGGSKHFLVLTVSLSASSSCVCVLLNLCGLSLCFYLVSTLVMAFKGHPDKDNLGSSYLGTLKLITYKNIYFFKPGNIYIL